MANPEHLEILKQGVEVWNKWREKNDRVVADLSRSELSQTNIGSVNFSATFLNEAILTKANLSNANLSHAILTGANLIEAKLNGANLGGSNLQNAKLGRAVLDNSNLRGAKLIEADFSDANLNQASLSGAVLRSAIFIGAEFGGVDLNGASMEGTTFGNNDLSMIKGLDSITHYGPSTVGIDTLYKSNGKIPDIFLRGCGLRDWEIEAAKIHNPDLSNEELTDILYRIHELRAQQAIQINPLFISYSHIDSLFVDELEKYLNAKGIRFWRDTHNFTSGRLERQVDRAIRLNPTEVLILSTASVKSDWVQHEVRSARALELQTGRDVLCPVALDDSWKSSRWPERIMDQNKGI